MSYKVGIYQYGVTTIRNSGWISENHRSLSFLEGWADDIDIYARGLPNPVTSGDRGSDPRDSHIYLSVRRSE
jgi:hypothetical protein